MDERDKHLDVKEGGSGLDDGDSALKGIGAELGLLVVADRVLDPELELEITRTESVRA